MIKPSTISPWSMDITSPLELYTSRVMIQSYRTSHQILPTPPALEQLDGWPIQRLLGFLAIPQIQPIQFLTKANRQKPWWPPGVHGTSKLHNPPNLAMAFTHTRMIIFSVQFSIPVSLPALKRTHHLTAAPALTMIPINASLHCMPSRPKLCVQTRTLTPSTTKRLLLSSRVVEDGRLLFVLRAGVRISWLPSRLRWKP